MSTDHSDQGGSDEGLAARLEAEQTANAELAEELYLARDKIAHLEVGMITARRIGAAVGVLMATRRLTADQAFDMLRITSQNRHRELRDVADDVLLTGTLPD